MQYRIVPRNGDRLSALGFGAMRLPVRRRRIDEPRAERQIYSAIDRGVNYLDTAAFYHGGESERFLGRILAGARRDQVRLATKLPPWSVKTRADLDRILDVQLKKLRTDRLDYYLLHALDANHWRRFRDLGVEEFLEAAKQAGKIKNAGFSFHGDRRIFREIIDAYPWACCLLQYNYLDRTNQAGIEGVRYAAGKQVAVLVMEPLRGGRLAGKLPPEARVIFDRAQPRRSPAAWALRWVWNHPEVTLVLSGMNDEGHIEENLRTCEDSLPNVMTAAELAVIEEAAGVFRRSIKVGCSGCGYCLPCPYGVNIPQCFQFYNEFFLRGNRMLARGMYGMGLMGGSGARADAALCQECGECIKVCPQRIAIPEELARVRKTLGGWLTRLMIPVVRTIFTAKVKE